MFCTTSETEGEVDAVIVFKHPAPLIHYLPFQCGSSAVVLCCLFLVSEFRLRFTLRVVILFKVGFGLLSGHILCSLC